MATIDLSRVIADYDVDDFGFSAVSEEEYNRVISEKADTVEELVVRLNEVEKIIMPFLVKLLKTADKAYIHWPNRKGLLEEQIKRILTLTRID